MLVTTTDPVIDAVRPVALAAIAISARATSPLCGEAGTDGERMTDDHTPSAILISVQRKVAPY